MHTKVMSQSCTIDHHGTIFNENGCTVGCTRALDVLYRAVLAKSCRCAIVHIKEMNVVQHGALWIGKILKNHIADIQPRTCNGDDALRGASVSAQIETAVISRATGALHRPDGDVLFGDGGFLRFSGVAVKFNHIVVTKVVIVEGIAKRSKDCVWR